MKILLGVPEFPPFNIGGGGYVFEELARAYTDLGHEVVVVYGYYPNKNFFSKIVKHKSRDITCYQVPEIPIPFGAKYLRTVMPPTPIALFQLSRILETEKPDIAHIHGYGHMYIDYLAFLLKRKGIKYIFTNHGFPKVPKAKGGIALILWKIYQYVVAERVNYGAESITCVSAHTKGEYVNKILLDKTKVISNGIRLNSQQGKKVTRTSLGITNNKLLLLSVGRMAKYKGYHEVVGVLKKSPNAVYLIAGEDAGYKNKILDLASRLGVGNQLFFAGHIPNKDINGYYSMADVVVIPSEVESFGLVGLEALKNKKCVITSGAEGLDYLKESTNVYFYNNNEDLSKLINTKLIFKNEDFINKYCWKIIAQEYLTCLKDTDRISRLAEAVSNL